MKITNWLIYTLAKSALFVVSALSMLVIFIELLGLITGRTLSFGSGAGIISFPKDPFASYPFYDRFMSLLPGFVIAVTACYACWQLGRILQSVKAGTEFREQNANRLYKAGVFIVVADLALILISVVNSNVVRTKINGEAINNNLYTDGNAFSYTWLIVGCIFIILSKVFERGTELQTEMDQTL